MWAIDVLMESGIVYCELCRCDSPESVSSVVLALCRSTEAQPLCIRRLPPSVEDVTAGDARVEALPF